MRALVITAPGHAEVQQVPDPVAGPGEVVVAVHRAGICGTDRELFSGEMSYLADGVTTYPIRIGHEWMGEVSQVGVGVDPGLLGRRVTGDTMIGCGDCARCRTGRHHLCDRRDELGVRDGRPGALAELVAVPAVSVHVLPDSVSDAAGALVEPGGNAHRAVLACQLAPDQRLLVLGAGAIGLLAALFARSLGATVALLDPDPRPCDFARSLGFDVVESAEELPAHGWDAVIDASTGPGSPALAARLVEPGGRIVGIGLAETPSPVDTRTLVLNDVTLVGILGASPALPATIAAYASGAVDPTPLVAATVTLEALPAVLAGHRPDGAGPGPKIHVRIG